MKEELDVGRSGGGAVVGGRYRVGGLLGRGGMGAVYRALDEGTGTWVALKRLAADRLGELGAMFEREYRTLASLRHGSIVSVFDYGLDDEGASIQWSCLRGPISQAALPCPGETPVLAYAMSLPSSACCMRASCCIGT